MSEARPVLLGVDVGGTKVGVALATLDREIVERGLIGTRATDGAEQVVRRACELGRSLVAAHGARVAAVGAVSPGVPGPDGVLLAPTIAGWEDLHFADAVRSGLADLIGPDVPVVVGNDVKAGALAEHRSGGLRHARTGLYLNLGTGVAAAAVVDGVVLAGSHGAAGEIAYQQTDPGRPGAADGRAPLEEVVGGRVLDATATRVAGRPTTAVEALQRGDDEAVRAALEPALAALDVAVVNACCLLDPDTVVVAGGLMRAADVLLPRLRRVVERGVPLPPTVSLAHHPFDAPLVGALLLAAEALDRGHPDRPDGTSADEHARLVTTKELA